MPVDEISDVYGRVGRVEGSDNVGRPARLVSGGIIPMEPSVYIVTKVQIIK